MYLHCYIISTIYFAYYFINVRFYLLYCTVHEEIFLVFTLLAMKVVFSLAWKKTRNLDNILD